jgi:hypothetical protein
MLIVDDTKYAEFQNAANYRRITYSDALEYVMEDFVKRTDEIREEDARRQEAKLLDPNEPMPPDLLQQQVLLEARIRDATHRIEKEIVTGEDADRERARIDDARKQLELLPRRMTESQLDRHKGLQDKSLCVRYGRPTLTHKPKSPKTVAAQNKPENNVFPFPSSLTHGEEVVTDNDDGEVVSDDGEVVI